ncbi:MAG: hypothetical protein C4582_10600 [Desulfobacteraceae bacterium]|nr:MAG: hypothetical protein C4582_10600 [Desulfobacteraceae bacterium]
MKYLNPHVIVVRICFLIFIAALSACTGNALVRDDETALRGRAGIYWQHRVKKAFAECYLMETPEVREGITITNYVMGLSGGIIWISASPKSISIDGDKATVQVEMTYAMFGMYTPKGGITRVVPDYWKRVDGVWYHLYQPPKKNP